MKEKPVKPGKLKTHLVASTALCAVGNPFFAAFETLVPGMGMADINSLISKGIAMGFQYGGAMGLLYEKGRNAWRNFFNINDDTSELRQNYHDALFLGYFNATVLPPIYTASNFLVQAINHKPLSLPEFDDLGGAWALGIGFGLSVGGPLCGYAVDIAKDVMGWEKCKRKFYPGFLRNNRSKKKLATIAAAGLIASPLAIYSITPDTSISDTLRNYFSPLEERIEQVEQNN